MSVWTVLAIVAAGWVVLSLPLALLVGRFIAGPRSAVAPVAAVGTAIAAAVAAVVDDAPLALDRAV